MPIYEYYCPECNKVEDIKRSIDDRNLQTRHSCGCLMKLKISLPRKAVFIPTGKDKILDTLNSEHIREKTNTGAPLRSKRSQDALVRGIDYQVPLEERVFAGFGAVAGVFVPS